MMKYEMMKIWIRKNFSVLNLYFYSGQKIIFSEVNFTQF